MPETEQLPGTGDDRFDRPRVTPPPAPPDDQLVKLAALSSVAGLLAVIVVGRWLRRNIVIRRRG